jgi:hypothetical protein
MEDLNGLFGLEVFHEETQVPNPLSDTELITSFLDDFANVEFVLEENIQPSLNNGIQDMVESPSPSSSSSFDECVLNIHQIRNTTLTDHHNQRQMKILCPICKEGDAGRHKHYGGNACISCRAFFRRSVQNEAYKAFMCAYVGTMDSTNNTSCDINSKSWSSCRYCRFQNCLSSGLRISLVLTTNKKTGRQTKINHGALKTNTKLVHENYSPSLNINSLSVGSFTNQDVMQISFKVAQFQFDHLFKELTFYFAQNPLNFDSLLKMYYRKHSEVGIVDVGNAKEFGNWWQNIFKQFLSTTYEDHNALGPDVLGILENYNMATVYFINSVVSIGNAICPSPLKELLECVYQRQRNMSQFLPQSASYQSKKNVAFDHEGLQDNFESCITTMATIASNQNVKAKPPDVAIDYNQAYPAEMWNEETKKWEKIINKNIHNVAKWPTFNSAINNRGNRNVTGKGQRKRANQSFGLISKKETTRLNSTKVNVDWVLVHLLSIVALYSVDTCTGIKDTEPIEKLQNKYLRLLHQYLTFRYPKDAYVRLARGMDVISQARESCEILQIFS